MRHLHDGENMHDYKRKNYLYLPKAMKFTINITILLP
jgi:hypothetical protein